MVEIQPLNCFFLFLLRCSPFNVNQAWVCFFTMCGGSPERFRGSTLGLFGLASEFQKTVQAERFRGSTLGLFGLASEFQGERLHMAVAQCLSKSVCRTAIERLVKPGHGETCTSGRGSPGRFRGSTLGIFGLASEFQGERLHMAVAQCLSKSVCLTAIERLVKPGHGETCTSGRG